jgi:hypothetical protein
MNSVMGRLVAVEFPRAQSCAGIRTSRESDGGNRAAAPAQGSDVPPLFGGPAGERDGDFPLVFLAFRQDEGFVEC